MDKDVGNNYLATVGADFKSREFVIDDTLVTMQVWDTAGQEKYQSIQRFYYRGADGCILVFDLTNPDSFVAVNRWHQEFLRAISDQRRTGIPCVLLANKVDLLGERKVRLASRNIQVYRAKIAEWCEEHDRIPFYETSAKTAENVREAFLKIAQQALIQQPTKFVRI